MNKYLTSSTFYTTRVGCKVLLTVLALEVFSGQIRQASVRLDLMAAGAR
jgi:hypothetical protein